MTPSSKLQMKLQELDSKEKEINNRKAKIRNMLNQELDMSNVSAAGSLNKTAALDSKSKPVYTEKVKPPSVVDKKSTKRASNQSIKDSVSDLMGKLF